MSELDALLAMCVAAPDDDAPRLVWADAIGGERGELVVLQCRLAGEDLPPADAGAMIARVDELLAAHGKAWSGFADRPAVRRCLFRRGFVESVEANVVELPLPSLFAAAPLVSALHVKGIAQLVNASSPEHDGPDPIAVLGELVAEPALPRLRAIGLDDAYRFEDLGGDEWDNEYTSRADEVCELIARSGALAGIRAFTLGDQVSARGIHELLASNLLASVERLALVTGSIQRSQARELVAAMPNLRALDLGNQAIALRDIVDVLPASLVELRGGILHDREVFDRFEAAVAPRIERLATGFATRYDAFARLRCLDVGSTAISGPRQGDPSYERVPAFARCSLPALRELHVFADLSTAELLMIADAFGPQLACLDLAGHSHRVTPELRARVAGHIRTGPYRKPEAFLEAGTNTREPSLGCGIVNLRS
jgi:uncharacterized protein (TIGR02996 family)